MRGVVQSAQRVGLKRRDVLIGFNEQTRQYICIGVTFSLSRLEEAITCGAVQWRHVVLSESELRALS